MAACVAPGPALTIKDLGPGVTFSATSRSCSGFGACTGTGSVSVSGTFDTSVLGGMPTTIQAQISNTAGGAPVSGCTACAWTNLSNYSATLSSGTVWNWSGQAVNVPAGWGPLFVSVCAANATPACATNNGTAYATMPSLFKMGLAFDVNGAGQVLPVFSAIGELAVNYFQGLFGDTSWTGGGGATDPNQLNQGPAVSGTNWFPAVTSMIPGDKFSIDGLPGEGGVDYQQLLTNAFGGWPVSVGIRVRDGVGTINETIGGQNQVQTVAVGDGSTLAFCSAATFCGATSTPVGTVSAGGPLYYTGAELFGATLAGAHIDNSSGSAGTTLTIPLTTGITQGGLEPGMVLSDTSGHITGSPTLVNCLTGCTQANFNANTAQTWRVSVSQLVTAETMRADPVVPAPAALSFVPQIGLPMASGADGGQLITAGTFKITVNGTVVCQDTNTFTYNQQSGNCTGANIASSFVNYFTGDYEIVFSSGHAPANNAVILASWTNLMTPDPVGVNTERPQQLDWFGDGVHGATSAIIAKNPGGLSGHILGAGQLDRAYFTSVGYAIGTPGYTRQVSWTYDTKMPNIIPGELANTPIIESNFWRAEGANNFINTGNTIGTFEFEQWVADFTAPSMFSGTISGSTLTLTSGTAGYTPWEGLVLGCNPFSLGCQVAQGTYITALLTGTWGASGSTYSLNQAGCLPTCTNLALENAVQYQGSGPTIEVGPMNDISVQEGPPVQTALAPGISPHGTSGVAGMGRVGRRWACAVWGGLTNGDPMVPAPSCGDPTLDRTAADALGCDSSAIAAPCLDDGMGAAGHAFPAIHTATWTGNVATITGGLAAHARPFVVGMALNCSGCNSNLVISAVSLPPTQDSRTRQGQIGQTFTVTANSAIGGSGSGTITAGCKSGTSGASNCVDIAFSLNTTGATALATCGENNLNGNAPLGQPAAGPCLDNGIGELVKGFRIGTTQGTSSPAPGTPYDDGADPINGGFARNLAFTCNLVAAKVVQCVKGPTWTLGVPALGQWTAGSVFMAYGDTLTATSRSGGMMGYPGGQSLTTMPTGIGTFFAGSGYTASTKFTVKTAYQLITMPSYNATTGSLTLNFATPPFGAAVGTQANGSNVWVQGFAGAGGALMNGVWPVVSTAVSGTQITVQVPTGLSTTVTAGASSLFSSCGTMPGGNAVVPALDFTTNSSGVVIDVAPSTTANAIGNGNLGVGTAAAPGVNGGVCNFFLTAGSGTGASIQLLVGPTEGYPGIGTVNTNSNLMGILLYDNSGFVGNPTNPFFTNYRGGYFEPGSPVKPFGEFLGVGVSAILHPKILR